jgi:hypothetical protein
MIKVKVVKDDSGHYYIIPNESYKEFITDQSNTEMVDNGLFDDKWGHFRTNGDLNLVQLYIYEGGEQ